MGKWGPRAAGRCHDANHPVQDGEVGVRRNDVDVIGLEGRAIDGGHDLHPARFGASSCGQNALVVRSEVLDHDERHAVDRDILEELAERFETARGGADPDDEEPSFSGLEVARQIPLVGDGLLLIWHARAQIAQRRPVRGGGVERSRKPVPSVAPAPLRICRTQGVRKNAPGSASWCSRPRLSIARDNRRVPVEVIVRANGCPSPAAYPVEIVERKGLGHPDSMCDGIAERICIGLCRYYLDHFGAILHHNVDKVLLCAGTSRPAFGGGDVFEPIEIYLAGRATSEHHGVRIPVHEIAIDACREWLRTNTPRLDLERDVQIASRLRPGSGDLTRVFARGGSSPLANDTSCGAGFAPLTDLERVVLAVERALNSPATKQRHPGIGEDIKVMGVRRDSRIQLTIACAFVDRFVADIEDYARRRTTVARSGRRRRARRNRDRGGGNREHCATT